ncbi:MAG: hypothetical protein DI535_12205 [Citrobacter freundii]|nr:MAG: hypothetical protein DI535_12205 [Citrobacter freundii]
MKGTRKKGLFWVGFGLKPAFSGWRNDVRVVEPRFDIQCCLIKKYSSDLMTNLKAQCETILYEGKENDRMKRFLLTDVDRRSLIAHRTICRVITSKLSQLNDTV